MPALSAIDLAMFLLETEARPFNIGPLLVLSPPKGFRGNFADKLVERMLRRPLGPPFNCRLQVSLTSLPTLEADAGAAPSAHVHRLTLDAPGSMAQLCDVVCRIHEIRLDRSRLLWDMHVIDGLEGGKVAVYAKVHHGLVDGRTFVRMMENWLAATPRERTVRALWEGLPRAPRTSRARATFAEAVGRKLRLGAGTTASALRIYRMLAKQLLATVGLGGGIPLPLMRVPDAFHGEAVADRSYAFCSLPLADVKAVAKANAATVNDVFLAVIDVAMARHLAERDALPSKPLVADMPLALKDAQGGNQIAVLQFPLGRPGMAPAERLAAIRAEAGKVKHVIQQEAADTVMLYTTLVHAVPALLERFGSARGLRVSNLLISNPFGLAEPRYLMGASVELALPMSVLVAGHMLNVTAVTLAERFQIGFLAMPQVVPHVERLAAYTRDAFAQLQSATLDPKTKPRAKPSAKPRRKAAKRSTRARTSR